MRWKSSRPSCILARSRETSLLPWAFAFAGILCGALPTAPVALAADRILIEEALRNRIVEADIRGKGSISALSMVLTKRVKEDVVVVVPPGTYFAPESKLEAQAYWSAVQITFPFLTAERSSLDIPVVKYVLQPGFADKNTVFLIHFAPMDKIPKVLDFMVKNGMSHEAKQLAVWVLQNPNLTRDEIDTKYYKYHTGFMIYTEEAVKADDPIHAFMALKHVGVALDVIRLYAEQASLVHALGSQDSKVRQFAMSELVQLHAVDKTLLDSGDYKAALLRFLKHDNRSVRYRAVRGLKGQKGGDTVRALISLLSDDTTVYAYPDLLGQSYPQTIRSAVIGILTNLRDRHEDDLISLLEDPDYKTRLAGIEMFRGSQKERVRATLIRLSERDEYKQVRDAANEALRKKK